MPFRPEPPKEFAQLLISSTKHFLARLPLDIASQIGYRVVVEELLKHGASPNSKDPFLFRNALKACMNIVSCY